MFEFQQVPLMAFMGMGMQELMIIGIVAVLLFGKRLPEVAKSLGSSYSQFRKGLNDLHSTIDYSGSSYTPPKSKATSRSSHDDYDDYDEPTAPKFEPPPSEPKVETPPSGEIEKPVAEK